jgi:hypothetical protein
MDRGIIDMNEKSDFSLTRVSWGAIFAGAVLALAIQLLMGLAGLSFGLGSINPMSEQSPFRGIGIGSAIWFFIMTVASLFVGGMVAGRFTNGSSKVRGLLHGATTWGLASLASFFLITSAVGGVLRVAGGAVGSVLGVVGQGAGAIVAEGAKAVGAEVGDMDLSSLKQEARKLLSQTGKPELQPRNLQATGRSTADSAQATAERVAQNPQAAEEEVDSLIDRVFARTDATVNAMDRDALINVLVARTDMNRTQAESTIAQWEKTFRQTGQKFAQVEQQAEQKAREVGQTIADTSATAAGWASLLLLLGLISASAGGWVGAYGNDDDWRRKQRASSLDLSNDLSSAA